MVRPVDFNQVRNAEAYMMIYVLKNPNSATNRTSSNQSVPISQSVPRAFPALSGQDHKGQDQRQHKNTNQDKNQSIPPDQNRFNTSQNNNTVKQANNENSTHKIQTPQGSTHGPSQFKPLINITAYPGGIHPIFGSYTQPTNPIQAKPPSWLNSSPEQLQKRAPEIGAKFVTKKLKRTLPSGLLRLKGMRKRLTLLTERSVSNSQSDTKGVADTNVGYRSNSD